jgi:hypothetical protein
MKSDPAKALLAECRRVDETFSGEYAQDRAIPLARALRICVEALDKIADRNTDMRADMRVAREALARAAEEIGK